MGPMAWLQKVTIYTAGWKRIGNTQKWKELMANALQFYRESIVLKEKEEVGSPNLIGHGSF